MNINKHVEKGAEVLMMINPTFTVSQAYMAAYAVIEAIKDIPLDTNISEPS